MITIFDLIFTCLFFLIIIDLLCTISINCYEEKYEIINYYEKYYNIYIFNSLFDNCVLENHSDEFDEPLINYDRLITVIYFFSSFIYFLIPE